MLGKVGYPIKRFKGKIALVTGAVNIEAAWGKGGY
jgi:hypothetical protein